MEIQLSYSFIPFFGIQQQNVCWVNVDAHSATQRATWAVVQCIFYFDILFCQSFLISTSLSTLCVSVCLSCMYSVVSESEGLLLFM